MKTYFYIDKAMAGVTVLCLSPGVIMTALAFIGFDSKTKLLSSFIVSSIVIILLWFLFSRGTYTVINNGNLRGKFLFIKGPVTRLSDVTAIRNRAIFGGFFTEIYMIIRRENGSEFERGLVNKPDMIESEYQRLFKTMLDINPDIQIDQSLLHSDYVEPEYIQSIRKFFERF